jgi:hypothetical protein
MSETATVAKEIEKQGEGMRILISEASKKLLDKVGGFRCDPRGPLDLAVYTHFSCHIINFSKFQTKGQIETFWLVGPDNTEATT